MNSIKRSLAQFAPVLVFITGVAILSYLLGLFSGVLSIPPARFIVASIKDAKIAIEESFSLPWYYVATEQSEPAIIHAPSEISPGLTLISGIGPDRELLAQVIDANGRTVHSWHVDWFELFPEPPAYLENKGLPQSKPGTELHGIQLTPDGGIVFNFERLALIRMDACGKVVWRLPYRTHHSVFADEDGTYWVSGQIPRREPRPDLPNYLPEFQDYTVLHVSPDGKILKEINLTEVLHKNGLQGLLYMATIDNLGTAVRGDTLHANDVESFQASMKPGIFSRGDLVVSLRNINTVFVFDQETLKIKFITIGRVLRQHDADFIDGNTLSIFDNNNLAPSVGTYHSRIVQFDARTSEMRVVYEGSDQHPFFTNVMGKQQYQPNGNILLTESTKGRVFEINPSGQIVWEYYNIVADRTLGIIHQANRLSPKLTADTFKAFRQGCSARK